MNGTLEAMARAIFKSWFVDFDPVRAKAEGRDPGLPKHIAALFPDRFEDSELGEIPAGVGVEASLAILPTIQDEVSSQTELLRKRRTSHLNTCPNTVSLFPSGA